jgi:hypothetical protein
MYFSSNKASERESANNHHYHHPIPIDGRGCVLCFTISLGLHYEAIIKYFSLCVVHKKKRAPRCALARCVIRYFSVPSCRPPEMGTKTIKQKARRLGGRTCVRLSLSERGQGTLAHGCHRDGRASKQPRRLIIREQSLMIKARADEISFAASNVDGAG